MAIAWSSRAKRDLERLHAFLAPADPDYAVEVVEVLLAAVRRLARTPRLGVRLPEFEPREVRRIFVANCEIRYELDGRSLFVLRIWHQREAR